MRTKSCSLACLALALCLATLPAIAQVDLRFDPPDTNLQAGQSCRLSILIDQPLEVRTIDVTVQYDPAVLGSLAGGPGALYTESGVFTFDGFENTAPGEWYGYSIAMGAGLFVQGPGELFYWEFEALADGSTPLHAVNVYLSMTDGTWYEAVALPDGRVDIGEVSGVPVPGPVASALHVGPNPFNPATEVSFELWRDGPVRLAVYDARGRRVAVLLDAPLPAGPVRARWDGRDDQGRGAPSGLYLFRLETDDGTRTARGVLLE